MTPAARLQAAIEILEETNAGRAPADRLIREWFRARRYAGSKDRAAIADRVFDILRHRASLAWRMGDESPRSLVIANVLADGGDAAVLFDGAGYGPKPLSDEERAVIASPPAGEAPMHVRGEFPEFLEPELHRNFGDRLEAEMTALQARATIDLRVNSLKATRNEVLATLRADGYAAEPARYSPFAIRVASQSGLAKLQSHAAFTRGDFEFQDEASQIASLLVGAKPGERVLDLAAGGGGKSLAMAASMNNDGELLAFDDIAERLKPLPERAARAGASCITVANKRGGPLWGNGKFDAVLVDAPCSGTGTWRRQPELRWRITPESLAGVMTTQAWLLDDAARHTKPGGRIAYVTCSLLPCENEDQIAAFLARHPDFTIRPASDVWRETAESPPPPGMNEFFHASPASTGTDGFFAAILVKENHA